MEYTFKFTQQEMQLLQAALGELPAKHSLSLIAKLATGQQEQDKAAANTFAKIATQRDQQDDVASSA